MPNESNQETPVTARDRDPDDELDRRLVAQAAEVARVESEADFGRTGPDENEVSLDDVRQFLDRPTSLPLTKIPSLVKYYGHSSEVACRLLSRDDCPPEAEAGLRRLHGHNPAFADYIIKHKGQLADDDNDWLYRRHRASFAVVANQLSHQQLSDELNWQIYYDHGQDRAILPLMINQQKRLPEDLVRQLYHDNQDQPDLVVSLITSQSLPEDVVRRSWDLYRRLPGFVLALFQYQKNLPAEIIDQGFNDYDRSFETVLDHQLQAEQVEPDEVSRVFDLSLTLAAIIATPGSISLADFSQPGSRAGELPADLVNQAEWSAAAFMAFVISLIKNNQLDGDLIGRLHDEMGQFQIVAQTMVEHQKLLPPAIIRQAFNRYGHQFPFVESMVKNQTEVPEDVLDQAIMAHRLDPNFDGGWFEDQANLSEKTKKELSRWLSARRLGLNITNLR